MRPFGSARRSWPTSRMRSTTFALTVTKAPAERQADLLSHNKKSDEGYSRVLTAYRGNLTWRVQPSRRMYSRHECAQCQKSPELVRLINSFASNGLLLVNVSGARYAWK